MTGQHERDGFDAETPALPAAGYLPVHDPATHGHAYAVKRKGQDTQPIATASVVVTWPEHAPDRKAPSCGTCGEGFAHDPAAPFTSPVLAAAVDAGILGAGWKQDGGTWTCTVCQAKANAPAPEPEPEARESEPEPAPDGDHYDQSLAILAAFDAGVRVFWTDVNQSNNKAQDKIHARLDDGYAITSELAARDVAA